MTIYQITDEFRRLQELSETGEFDEEALTEALTEICSDLTNKATGYCNYMAHIKSISNNIDAEIKRLQDKKSAYDTLYSKMDETLLQALLLTPTGIIETPTYTIKVRNNPASVIINDVSKLSNEYLRTVIKTDPDKVKIKEALKNGEVIDGCTLAYSKSLIIK